MEFFQKDELENALDILKKMPSPYACHFRSCIVIDPVFSNKFRRPPDAGVIRIELSDGAGLPSYSSLYTALASGVPMVVSGIDPGHRNLTPDFFIERHGTERVKIIRTLDNQEEVVDLAIFMESFGSLVAIVNPAKLKVCPPMLYSGLE